MRPGAVGVHVRGRSEEGASSCPRTERVVPARQARPQRGPQFLVCGWREPSSKAERALLQAAGGWAGALTGTDAAAAEGPEMPLAVGTGRDTLR